MTAIAPRPIISRPSPAHVAGKGSPAVEPAADDRPQDDRPDVPDGLVRVLHHRRPDGDAHARPSWPGRGCSSCRPEQYNQLFTMHGTLMLLMFATPLFFAFGNLIMPLQIGSPDVAFPRLNALSFWLFLFGSTIVVVRLPDPRRRGRLRLDGLRAAVRRRALPRRRRRTCGSPAWRSAAWARSWAASTSSPRSSACARRA